MAGAFDNGPDHGLVHFVVFGDQDSEHPVAARRHDAFRILRIVDIANVADRTHDGKPEAASAARRAVHPDLSAHRLRQVLRYGEPEAGAAVSAGD